MNDFNKTPKKVLVRGPALSQSGYGEHARFVLRALKSRPDLFDIYLLNTPWGATSWVWENNKEREWIDFLLQKTIQYGQAGGQFDISLQVTIPNEWEKIAPINIGVTAGIETTKIAPVWIEKSFQMDKIIVVSEHAKFGFENTEVKGQNSQTQQEFIAKVNCPIDVVGYPVKNIDAVKPNLELKDDFNFLTIGTWIPRKNLEKTIKWFVEEFYDQEIGLVVKTSLAKNCLRDREVAYIKLKQLLNEYKDRKCSVYLLHGDMTEQEMTGLYQHPKIKALVSIAHGEGFGLPMFEAAYNALPIVCPAWGGQCDYLYMPIKNKKGKTINTPMFTMVPYDIKAIQKEAHWEGVLQADSQWCFAKEWAYKKALRSIIKETGAVKSKAKKLQKYIIEEFAKEKKFNELCESVCPQLKLEDAEYVFVSDFFADEVIGGAELSLEALIEKCPGTYVKCKSAEVSEAHIQHYRSKKWIFGNMVMLNSDILGMMSDYDLNYHIIEFDFKFCKHRSPELHEFFEKASCECVVQNHGKRIKEFFKHAKAVFFMSDKQKQKHSSTFGFNDNFFTLSSVFNDDFFEKISSLRTKHKNDKNSSWVMSGSPNWIKGADRAKKWCEENEVDATLLHGASYDQALETLAKSNGLCFLPNGGDTCPRLVIEAKLLGCNLELNENVLHKDEKWFQKDIVSIEKYLKGRRNWFWKTVQN